MHPPENKSGSVSFLTLAHQNRNSRDGFAEQLKVFQQADRVDLLQIMHHYRLDVDAYNRKICCPFKFHHDKTPSFYIYPDTNSFYCWGCKSFGGALNFVSLYESIPKSVAAQKILTQFEASDEIESPNEISEWRELYLSFSSRLREFIQANKEDSAALQFAHTITLMFDQITHKHTLDLLGLKHLLDKLNHKLKEF